MPFKDIYKYSEGGKGGEIPFLHYQEDTNTTQTVSITCFSPPLWFCGGGDHTTTTVQLLRTVLTYTRRRDAPNPSGSLMQSEW